jgi:hypothetical protein
MAKDDSGKREEQKIIDARKVLEPQEVKQGKVPGWLSKKVRAYCKRHELCTRGSAGELVREVLYDVQKSLGVEPYTILDHWGTSVGGPYVCCNEASKCFVTEPYGFDFGKAQVLEAFCAILGLEWHVSSNTWWNPGATVRITIHEDNRK